MEHARVMSDACRYQLTYIGHTMNDYCILIDSIENNYNAPLPVGSVIGAGKNKASKVILEWNIK